LLDSLCPSDDLSEPVRLIDRGFVFLEARELAAAKVPECYLSILESAFTSLKAVTRVRIP